MCRGQKVKQYTANLPKMFKMKLYLFRSINKRLMTAPIKFHNHSSVKGWNVREIKRICLKNRFRSIFGFLYSAAKFKCYPCYIYIPYLKKGGQWSKQ